MEVKRTGMICDNSSPQKNTSYLCLSKTTHLFSPFKNSNNSNNNLGTKLSMAMDPQGHKNHRQIVSVVTFLELLHNVFVQVMKQ